MEQNLLELSAEKLLAKFGAGNHKPGSGSAAAFQGMLSAELLVTVISLTNEEKRRNTYKSSLPKLLKMNTEIRDRILPELTGLFQEDSIQFGKAIASRKERDDEKDPKRKSRLARQALDDLKIAIELPLRIADLNVELAGMAAFIFDNGFQGARGDTQVGLSGAVAAVGGCLSIVHLNLLQYGSDEYDWIENVKTKADELRTIHEKLNSIATSKIEILGAAVKENVDLYKEVNRLVSESKGKKNISDVDIEDYATQLQLLVWKHRQKIWKKNIPTDPIEILKPDIIFKTLLGYNFYKSGNLGLNNNSAGLSEIAGEIDQSTKIVLISNQIPEQTQRFTAAHELGHALLHNQVVLHRDLPLDGANQMSRKAPEEYQADKFATYFLMPGKQVLEVFEEYFSTARFKIEQHTAFNLIQDNPSRLRSQCKNLRGLSRKLATATSYSNNVFIPLAELFHVSVEAMAIRLEELGLAEF